MVATATLKAAEGHERPRLYRDEAERVVITMAGAFYALTHPRSKEAPTTKLLAAHPSDFRPNAIVAHGASAFGTGSAPFARPRLQSIMRH